MKCKVGLTVIGILAGFSTTFGQSPTTNLIDYYNQQPVEFATLQCISIAEDTNITFATSDKKGRVSPCNCNGRDSIKWKIRHLAYLPIDTILSCQHIPDTIFMYSRDYDFGEVIVSGKNEGVRVIGDSIRFDLSVFRKPHHRDLKDLLNDLPGINVTDKGRVEYKGKQVGQILLSGKSAARNQFDMFNRVIKKEDLSTVQLFPDDPEADEFDQVMTLDLVLKPDINLLGQIQSRLSNQGEIEGSASLVRSGDTKWNHSAEVAFSQIADSHRPQLNLLREVFDGTNRFKNDVKIKIQRPKLSLPANTDRSKEDQDGYAFYNALYEDDHSELNFYTRYKNHTSRREFEQTHFNVNSSETLFTERNIEEVNVHSGLFTISWKYKAGKNLTLRASSHFAHDVHDRNQNGIIEFADADARINEWTNQNTNSNASIFAHALWEIDSSWTFQTGFQFGTDDHRGKYDFGEDSILYGILVHSNSQDANLGYKLNRDRQNFDVGTALEHKWKTLHQKTAWVINYKLRSMSDEGGLEEIDSAGDAFLTNQFYKTYTISNFLQHEIKVSKVELTAEFGGTVFQGKQVLTGNKPFRWTATTQMRYNLNRDQFIFLGYSSNADWLDENNLWRSIRPINLQTYARAGNSNPAVIRDHTLTAGWKEFSMLKGNFSEAKMSYQYKPIHYEWRQRTEIGFNVDTLVQERDFNEFGLNLRTIREIRGVRISASLHGTQSYSYGEELFTDQKLTRSDLTFRINARDILKSKIIFISLQTLVNRRSWQFGEQSMLPPQWNSSFSIEARWFITKFNAWIASELTYLWRGNIYNETLASGSIEKQLGEHFTVSVGGENLFNLNNNLRRNRFISAEEYRESEQTVFGGRVYLRVKYQL